MAVSDRSVTERRRWRLPYQTGKTVHVHAKHYIHEDGRTACAAVVVCGSGSIPLSHSGNVVSRTGLHTYIHLFTSNKELELGEKTKENIFAHVLSWSEAKQVQSVQAKM